MNLRICLLLLLLLPVTECTAQWHDDFEDGELLHAPPWTGDLTTWNVETYVRGHRLRTNGPASADTLFVRTDSGLPYGTWTTHFGYGGGSLTNFNHVRLILWTSGPDLLEASGYLLQLGANDRTLRLSEFGDGLSSRRLLASSALDELQQDSTDFALVVERSYDDRWTVVVNGQIVMTVDSSPDADGVTGSFGLWVKHTAGRGKDFWFDDVGTNSAVISDTTRPEIVSAAATSRTSLAVRFSEPLLRTGVCSSSLFMLLPAGSHPDGIDCPESLVVDSITLQFETGFVDGTRLTAFLTDPSRNASHDTVAVDLSRTARLPARGDLVINEIDYAPIGSEREFVEILNISDRHLDLDAVGLTDGRTRTSIGEATLSPGDYLALTRDTLGIEITFGDVDAIQLEPWPSLNNTGDHISLVMFSDTLDGVAYEPSWNDHGNSLERRDPHAPSGFPGNWGSSTDPLGATPGRKNSILSQDREPPQLIFAGLLPGLPHHVAVFFSEDLELGALDPTNFSLAGVPAQRLVLGTEVYSDRVVLRFPESRAGTLRATTLTDPSGNTSLAGEVRLHLRPEPESIVINEIMYQPISDRFDGLPDQVEYVELRSRSSEPLAVNGCALIGRTTETGETPSWRLPDGPTGLLPHVPTALVRAGEVTALKESFRVQPDARTIAILEGDLSLPSERSLLQLECPDAGRIDSVMYDPMWHDGALTSVRGISLERIDVHASSNEPTNWTSSLSSSGGTPAAENSVINVWPAREMRPGDVVISELMFEPRNDDGAAPQYEYVEIFNRSNAAVDVNGAMFTDGHLDSTASLTRFVFAPAPLEPSQYGLAMLLPSSAGETDPDELLTRAFPSTADRDWPLFAVRRSGWTLPNGGSVITLLNASFEVVDRIVYSPRDHHPHLAQTRGVALERISSASSGEHPLNWTSSVHPEGGTPGRMNSVATNNPEDASPLSIHPSPFTPDGDGDRDHAVITYSLDLERPLVRITIFDSRGREVRRLTNGLLSSRTGSTVWDGFNSHGGHVPPGIYIIYLHATDQTAGRTEDYKRVVVVAPPFD